MSARIFIFIGVILFVATGSTVEAKERKFNCYFTVSGGFMSGSHVAIWASSKSEAEGKAIAYLRNAKGSNVRITKLECRG